MTNKKRIVKDIHGLEYELLSKLGEGGQGIVCKTNYPNVLVKISKPLLEDEKKKREDQLAWLMRLPLADLHIAHPLALINQTGRVGYVMELMEGLIPLKDLLETILTQGLEGFLETGGLHRRLVLLAKLARTLAKLHGMGLAYGDLSSDNIFISKQTDFTEVWLIDCDNICYHSRTSEIKLYTPRYGAPEIINNLSGINTFTDSWGFAVIAYQLLTMNHPLIGDMVNDGELELEEQALEGKLPWVGHSNEENSCSAGIPSSLVFGKKLTHLMDQCFRVGLNTPDERPTMNVWADAFEEAMGVTLKCENCNSTFYYNKNQTCPFCDHSQENNKSLLLKEYFWLPASALPEDANPDKDCWIATGRAKVIQYDRLKLKPPMFDYASTQKVESLCTLELKTDGLRLEPASNKISIHLQRNEKIIDVTSKMRLKTDSQSDANFLLHLGNLEVQHPVWRFKW